MQCTLNPADSEYAMPDFGKLSVVAWQGSEQLKIPAIEELNEVAIIGTLLFMLET